MEESIARGCTYLNGKVKPDRLLASEHGWNPDWIERQLAHEQKSKVRRAYNAAMYLDGRRQLMNWWGQFLEDQKARK